jgi:hypothetical protein
MTAATRREFPGRFATHELGSGLWHLTSGDRVGAEIYLVGADPGAARILRGTNLVVAALEWRDQGVLLTLNSSDGTTLLHARAALVHEPLGQLYRSLPLARLDSSARRFWRRVFWLVRIPGGRHLLRFLARRRREF